MYNIMFYNIVSFDIYFPFSLYVIARLNAETFIFSFFPFSNHSFNHDLTDSSEFIHQVTIEIYEICIITKNTADDRLHVVISFEKDNQNKSVTSKRVWLTHGLAVGRYRWVAYNSVTHTHTPTEWKD